MTTRTFADNTRRPIINTFAIFKYTQLSHTLLNLLKTFASSASFHYDLCYGCDCIGHLMTAFQQAWGYYVWNSSCMFSATWTSTVHCPWIIRSVYITGVHPFLLMDFTSLHFDVSQAKQRRDVMKSRNDVRAVICWFFMQMKWQILISWT